jgi:hypothetical protein
VWLRVSDFSGLNYWEFLRTLLAVHPSSGVFDMPGRNDKLAYDMEVKLSVQVLSSRRECRKALGTETGHSGHWVLCAQSAPSYLSL